MSHDRRHAMLTVVTAALSLTLAGPPAVAQSEAASDQAGGSKVVATVNGEPITQSMVEQYMNQRGDREPQMSREQVINELVTQELLAQAAEAQGIDERPDIVATVENTARNILARAAVADHVTQNPVSDQALRKAYDEQSAKMGGSEEYKARHILVEDKETAESIIAELDKGGDFGALAKEHSTGPTGKRGGRLGWVSPDSTVEAFGTALTRMEVGSYTKEPVESRFGWHVIKLEDTREAEAPSYEDVKGQLRQALQRETVQRYLEQLRADADVEIKASSGAADSGAAGAGD